MTDGAAAPYPERVEPTTDPPPIDERSRVIALASAVVSGALFTFWIVQILRGTVALDRYFAANVAFFVVAAVFFARTSTGQEIAAARLWPFLVSAFSFVHDKQSKNAFGIAGVVTFAVTVGLIVTATALDFRRRTAGATTSEVKRRELEKDVRRSRIGLPIATALIWASALTFVSVRPPTSSPVWGIALVVGLVASLFATLDVAYIFYFGRALARR